MGKSSASRVILICSLILFAWGIVYIILSGSGPAEPSDSELFRLESISKGILITFMGLVIFHLPPLLRRGEYQALRIMNFTFFFLLVLAGWHAMESPLDTLPRKVTLIVLSFCSLLLLAGIIQFRSGRRLPRL
jgi:hypothetical protein